MLADSFQTFEGSVLGDTAANQIRRHAAQRVADRRSHQRGPEKARIGFERSKENDFRTAWQQGCREKAGD